MSTFYNQSARINSSLLGKRNQASPAFNLEQHLRNQFSRSTLSSTLCSDESRKTSYDSKEGEHHYPHFNLHNSTQLPRSEAVFGSISDSYHSDYEKARVYAADLRFVPAGPRPPVPPVGGNFTFNDAADTIKINQRCLQSFTYNTITKQNI